jgi:hypothetical protein
MAGKVRTVTGNQGIDVTAINAFTTTALQSGGNLNLSSDGLINVDASLSSGSNLSFLNLTGGTGNLFNGNQTILESKGVVNLGNYTGVSLKVEAAGSIRGGDITITGRKKDGVDPSDPDHYTLTHYPALILRAGLSDPASIISIGNVTVHSGVVDLSTNGNIFTGNIDVSSDDLTKLTGQKQIKLKAHNIFTGNLNAGSNIAPGTTIPIYECYASDVPIDGTCSDSMEIHDPAGSISLEATQYLRTGNIDASSRTASGGNVTIQASDAIVGLINTSGSTNTVYRRRSDFYGNLVDYSYSFNGGNVSVKTDTFKVGTISTDGGQKKGKVTIDAPPSVPIPDSGNDTGSGSGQVGSGSNQTNTADGASGGSANASGASSGDTSGVTISHSEPIGSNSPPDDTNVAYPPASLFISDLRASFSNQDDFVKDSLEETQSEDGLDSTEAVRRRILTFLEARQLAGEKWTAQAIAQKLDIPLEIAQIAVLNPIGQNIKVPIPDISALYSGTLVAGDSADTGVFCGNDGLCKVIVGGIGLVFGATWDAANNLLDHILQSKSKDVPKDNGEDNEDSRKGKNGVFEPSSKHGSKDRGNISRGPTDGQEALDESVQVKDTSTRRLGVDKENDEIVVLDETTPGVFHGHVRTWDQLTTQMKDALQKAGLVNKKGKILD